MMDEVEAKAKDEEKMKREMEEEKLRKERVRDEFRRVAELMVKRWSEIPQNSGAESTTEVDDEEMVEEMSKTRPEARQSFEPDSSTDSDDLWTDEEEEEEMEELGRGRERRLLRKMGKRPGVCQDRDASPDSLSAPGGGGGGRGDSLWVAVEEEKMMLVQFQRIRAEIHFKRKRYREIKREVKKRVMQEAEERRERLRQMFGEAIASEMAREWARAQYSDTDTDTDTDTEDLWEEEDEDEKMICEALEKQREQIEEERKSDGDMATLREEEKKKREMGEEDLRKERERDEEAELRKERERDQFRKVAELMAMKWSEVPQDSDTESATDSDDPWMDEEEKEIILEACRRRQAQIETEGGRRNGGRRKF